MTPWSFIKKNTRFAFPSIIIVAIINGLFAVLGILFAWLSKDIVNEATKRNTNAFYILAICLVAVIISQIILQFLVLFFNTRVRGKLKKHYQSLVFSNLIKQNSLDLHSGEYLTILTSDIQYLTEGMTYILPRTVLSISRFIGASIAIALIKPILLAFVAVFGLAFIVFHFYYKKKISPLHADAQRKEATSRSFMQEVIEHSHVLSTFRATDHLTKENDNRLLASYKAEVKRSDLSMLANLGINVAQVGSSALMLIISAYFILKDPNFNAGDLLGVVTLYGQLQQPIANLADISQSYNLMMESTKRILAILRTWESTDEVHTSFKKIEILDMNFSYPKQEVFKNTEFHLKSGETITIKGPSGIGKSTLIKILLGKHKITSEIKLDNKNADITSLFAYVPQGIFLLSGSIKDSLTLYNHSITNEEINEAIKIVALDDLFKHITINDGIKERAQDISEGQAQRLAIARALLLKRPILLLDEATSALDPVTEQIILKNLAACGKTIIYISHKEASNDFSDRIYRIEDKKLMEVE